MNCHVEAFLKEVLEKVKYTKIHPSLAQELNDHIELLKDEFLEQGFDEDIAYEKAVQQMGEPHIVGAQLHKMHRPKIEWSIIVVVLGLIGIGLFTLFSYDKQFQEGAYFKRQLIFLAIGIVLFLIMYFIDYTKFEKHAIYLYIIAAFICIITMRYGTEVNGVKRWIPIGPFYLQPTSIATPMFIISYISILRKWINKGSLGYSILIVLGIFSCYLCSTTKIMNGLALAATYLAIFLIYIYKMSFHGNKKKTTGYLLGTLLAGLGGISYFILSAPWRMQRIAIWLNPNLDPVESGYASKILRSIAIESEWIGNHGYKSVFGESKWFLPGQDASQFIFSFILGNLGIAIAIIVLLLITILIIRCFKSGKIIRDEYGKLLFYGITIFFAIQFIGSIGINLGLFPETWCYLPFVSYGSISAIFDVGFLGLLLGIYRRKDITPHELIRINNIIEINNRNIARGQGNLMVRLAVAILEDSNHVEEIQVKFKNPH